MKLLSIKQAIFAEVFCPSVRVSGSPQEKGLYEAPLWCRHFRVFRFSHAFVLAALQKTHWFTVFAEPSITYGLFAGVTAACRGWRTVACIRLF
jgi:hypothetical protein